MEASQCQRGKCCAGKLCFFEHLELRVCHKCTVCHQVVHVFCGHGSKHDDTLLICKLCQQTTEIDNDLQKDVQESTDYLMNEQPRKTKNKQYPNETDEARELRLLKRRRKDAQRRASESQKRKAFRLSSNRKSTVQWRAGQTQEKRASRLSADRESTTFRRAG